VRCDFAAPTAVVGDEVGEFVKKSAFHLAGTEADQAWVKYNLGG
jgi:hypothetical protein